MFLYLTLKLKGEHSQLSTKIQPIQYIYEYRTSDYRLNKNMDLKLVNSLYILNKINNLNVRITRLWFQVANIADFL